MVCCCRAVCVVLQSHASRLHSFVRFPVVRECEWLGCCCSVVCVALCCLVPFCTVLSLVYIHSCDFLFVCECELVVVVVCLCCFVLFCVCDDCFGFSRVFAFRA